MEIKNFRNEFDINCKKLNFKKFKSSYFLESSDTIIFILLIKSGYSKNYYFRIKTQIKPFEKNLNPTEFIQHDASDIMMSIESESPEIFDFENGLSGELRLEKLKYFFENNVANWVSILLNRQKIIEVFKNKKIFLLPNALEKLKIIEK